jgi:hypothetical protein
MRIPDDKLLVAEYQHFADAFLKNEESGEHRVTFFITVATTVIGGVVLVTNQLRDKNLPLAQQIATAALLGVLLFGFLTFCRILHRDRVTEEYKGVLRYLREQLRQRSDSLDGYTLPLRSPQHPLLRGGLGLTTAVINSFVAASIAPIWLPGWKGWLIALLVFVSSIVIHSVVLSRNTPHD